MDPLFFIDDKDLVWEDWLVKMEEKLLGNKDYYLIEMSWITYLLLRIGGEVIFYTLNRRRKGIINLYTLVSEVMDQLAEIYEEMDRCEKVRCEYDFL